VAIDRAAIALERYWLVHKEYPSTLEGLGPNVSAELTGLATEYGLHYRLRAGGNFLLYSAGLDGRDDGDEHRDVLWKHVP
jgi:hypothetical protein